MVRIIIKCSTHRESTRNLYSHNHCGGQQTQIFHELSRSIHSLYKNKIPTKTDLATPNLIGDNATTTTPTGISSLWTTDPPSPLGQGAGAAVHRPVKNSAVKDKKARKLNRAPHHRHTTKDAPSRYSNILHASESHWHFTILYVFKKPPAT